MGMRDVPFDGAMVGLSANLPPHWILNVLSQLSRASCHLVLG